MCRFKIEFIKLLPYVQLHENLYNSKSALHMLFNYGKVNPADFLTESCHWHLQIYTYFWTTV
jgi:hypothetical protein